MVDRPVHVKDPSCRNTRSTRKRAAEGSQERACGPSNPSID
jgi:hypothetical protein